MGVAGTYDVTVKTPMGNQQGTLTVNPDGNAFSGELVSPMGRSAITGGTVSGDRLTWQMGITSPMPLTLDCEATITGDNLSGSVKAGVFGSMGLTGTRKG